MPYLKKLILNELENKPRGYSEELAHIAGYSSGSALKKVLREEKKEFDKFAAIEKILHELFPGQEKELISRYAIALDPNKQTSRYMLEYSMLNGLQDVRKKLIVNMLDCSNAQSREWASVYHISLQYKFKQISFLEAIEMYNNVSAKTKEMQVLTKILQAYCYLDEQMYDIAEKLVFNLESAIKEIREEYISDVFLGRIYLILAECYNRKGNKELARQASNAMINTVKCKKFTSWGLLQLGNSYILESYEKSNKYLSKGFMLSFGVDENTSVQLKRSLNFLDNLWKKNPRHLDLQSNHPADYHEIAFYYINHTQYNKAMELLNKDDLNKITDNQRAFHFYLKGLITRNISDFSQSIKAFKKSGDYFFRQLPLLEIRKMDIDSDVLDIIETLAM